MSEGGPGSARYSGDTKNDNGPDSASSEDQDGVGYEVQCPLGGRRDQMCQGGWASNDGLGPANEGQDVAGDDAPGFASRGRKP